MQQIKYSLNGQQFIVTYEGKTYELPMKIYEQLSDRARQMAEKQDGHTRYTSSYLTQLLYKYMEIYVKSLDEEETNGS